MFHRNCGVTLHCTAMKIPPVVPPLEHIWTRKIQSPLDLYFRPFAYGGSVFVLFRDRRVTRLTEHAEETIDCAMSLFVQLMGAGDYLLIPSADQQLGVYSLRDKSLRIVSGLEGWHPCGAETSDTETSVVLREQTLSCERGELVSNGRKLIGNLIDGVLYGIVQEADGSETRGALDLRSNEWLWTDDRFESLIEFHDETMIVNVRGEAKNEGEVWDRRTRKPIHRRASPYVAAHCHFREDSVISQGGVFDLATGELKFPLSYSAITTYLSQGSQLWYLEDRLATGGRDQAIVCLDVDEQQELYRLPISSVKGRGRSDFLYDDGKFYRLLGRRLECYAPAE